MKANERISDVIGALQEMFYTKPVCVCSCLSYKAAFAPSRRAEATC